MPSEAQATLVDRAIEPHAGEAAQDRTDKRDAGDHARDDAAAVALSPPMGRRGKPPTLSSTLCWSPSAAPATATAAAMTRLRADFTPDGHRRRDAAFARFAADPAARMPIAAGWVGPDALPPEAFTREAADRMLALS